jgi:uncharacterized protein
MCPHESSDTVPPDIDSVSAVLRAELSREEGVDFAYLFGSLAKGRPRRVSDVDVAVHLSEDAPDARSPGRRLDRALEIEGRLERALGRTVQVVVLNDAPLELRFNVLAHGLLLHAPDHAARRRFYVETGRRYYDMAPARAMFRRRQRERIREGRFGG